MGLGINTEGSSNGGGKFLPIVKFDAKAGDMIVVNREPAGDGTWDKNEVEVELPQKVVMDLGNIEIGWISFQPSYSAHLVKVGERMPMKPSDEHKQAVRIKVLFKDHGLREFTPTSKTVLRAIDTLHDQYVEQAPAHKGKMPVVLIDGTETVKIQTPQGELRFKVPKWQITGWVDPPAAFGEADAPAPVAAPAPKPAPAKAAALDDDEF